MVSLGSGPGRGSPRRRYEAESGFSSSKLTAKGQMRQRLWWGMPPVSTFRSRLLAPSMRTWRTQPTQMIEPATVCWKQGPAGSLSRAGAGGLLTKTDHTRRSPGTPEAGIQLTAEWKRGAGQQRPPLPRVRPGAWSMGVAWQPWTTTPRHQPQQRRPQPSPHARTRRSGQCPGWLTGPWPVCHQHSSHGCCKISQ